MITRVVHVSGSMVIAKWMHLVYYDTAFDLRNHFPQNANSSMCCDTSALEQWPRPRSSACSLPLILTISVPSRTGLSWSKFYLNLSNTRGSIAKRVPRFKCIRALLKGSTIVSTIISAVKRAK